MVQQAFSTLFIFIYRLLPGGAPPPYRPRSTADAPRDLPPYLPDDQLDLDDPSAVPFDDPLPPPMPVLPNSRSVPGK